MSEIQYLFIIIATFWVLNSFVWLEAVILESTARILRPWNLPKASSFFGRRIPMITNTNFPSPGTYTTGTHTSHPLAHTLLLKSLLHPYQWGLCERRPQGLSVLPAWSVAQQILRKCLPGEMYTSYSTTLSTQLITTSAAFSFVTLGPFFMVSPYILDPSSSHKNLIIAWNFGLKTHPRNYDF